MYASFTNESSLSRKIRLLETNHYNYNKNTQINFDFLSKIIRSQDEVVANGAGWNIDKVSPESNFTFRS